MKKGDQIMETGRCAGTMYVHLIHRSTLGKKEVKVQKTKKKVVRNVLEPFTIMHIEKYLARR